jgi:hypothetical protein
MAVLGLGAAARGDTPRPADEQDVTRDDSAQRRLGRVGHIFIIGNTWTRSTVIMRQIHFKPGDPFSLADLRVVERNLARLNLFVVDPRGVHPTVKVLDPVDPDDDSPYKDILIEVQEKPHNDWLWAIAEPLEFAASWHAFGLAAAFQGAGGYPFYMLDFAVRNSLDDLPPAIRRYLEQEERQTGYVPPPTVVP